MTCKACEQWCVTSEAQLAARMKNMSGAPGVTTNPCPQCHGTDWATTRKMIGEKPPRVSWYHRIVMWFGENPNAWLVLVTFNLVCAVGFMTMALFMEQQRWMTCFHACLAGFNLAAAINGRYTMKMRQAFNQMRSAFNVMRDINNELVSGHFEAMIIRPRRDEDDDAPIAPTRLN